MKRPDLVSKPLNILLVTTKLPYPPTDGGRIVVYESLKRLAERGHNVTLLCFSPNESQDVAALEQFCRVELVAHDTSTRWFRALMHLFSPVPYNISKYHAEEMSERIHQFLAQEDYDLVHLEHLHMAFYASTAREHHVPVVLRQQNVESQITERLALGSSKLQRLYAHVQSGRMKRYEASACEQADLCLAITAADARSLLQLNPRIRTAVVPAGVDLQYFAPVQDVSEEPFTIVSVAALDWLPNVDSVLWFCDRIFPRVRQELPQARLLVVGKNPPASVRALARRENVVVTGFVEDIRQYIAQGSVVVVPMRMGGGIRVRILQAMAMGKPVVSTSLGAEGIDVTDREDILLADGEADFAQATVQLLREPALRRHIGANAHQLVERRYSWDTVVALAERIYRGLVQGSGQDGQLDPSVSARMD